MKTSPYKNPSTFCEQAKVLRKNASKAERILWDLLSPIQKVHKIRFRRQHTVHPYIAAFACVKAWLLIEIDGYSHDVRVEHDKVRENFLREKGWKTLRFSNQQVYENPEGVALTILKEAKK